MSDCDSRSEMISSPGLGPLDDRKYQPPPPSADNANRQGRQQRMTKDDLHEWSIYRQNLTSSIAESVLAQQRVAAAASAGGAAISAANLAAAPPPHSSVVLPYGNFQMHDQSIESVLHQGRQEDYLLGDKGDIYLKFGLPRVALQQQQRINNSNRVAAPPIATTSGNNNNVAASYNRAGGGFEQQQQYQPQFMLHAGAANNYYSRHNNYQQQHNSGGGYYSNQQAAYRKSQSEMDIRRAVFDTPSGRGPYFSPSHGGNFAGGGISKFSGSLENGLDLLGSSNAAHHNVHDGGPLDSSPHYAQSDMAGPTVNHVFDPTEFRRRQIALPNGAAHHLHTNGLLTSMTPGHHMTSGPSSSVAAHEPYAGGGAFLQGKRHHHSHYFSNLDLFTSSNAYNYLRYVKSDELQAPVVKQPNLQARQVGFDQDVRSSFDVAMLRSPVYRRILDSITFDVYGGETLAIMYTSEEEINALLGLLTNVHNMRGKSDGSFLVNGLPLRSKSLGDRIAYVCSHDLYPYLTVREHLRLISVLMKPATNAFRRNSMIAQLIQTLALGPFHDRLINELGRTERQRVKVACQILLDTDIIVLDHVTLEMDLYDSAFLVDYLRDWASKLSRIVIMAINPPTFEMLAMFSKVDLFTHDHLTVDASIESRERIKRFADNWQQKSLLPHDVSVPGIPPPRIYRTNPFSAIFWLYYRFWLMLFNQPWQYVRELFYSLIISLLLGAIFYQLSSKQSGINDRLGLFYALLTLGLLPNLFLNIERIHTERTLLYNDWLHNLYLKFSFFFARIIFDFPLAVVVYSIYGAPLYFMAKLQAIVNDQGYAFGIYMGLVVLYSLTFRMLTWAITYCTERKFTAAFFVGFCVFYCALTTGVTVHTNDLWSAFGWFRYGSPTAWLEQIFCQHEFLGNVTQLDVSSSESLQRPLSTLQFECSVKEIKYGPIVTRLPCPVSSGEEALKFTNLTLSGVRDQNMTYYVGIPVIGGYGLLFFVFAFFFIHCNYVPKRKLKHRES